MSSELDSKTVDFGHWVYNKESYLSMKLWFKIFIKLFTHRQRRFVA